jgi:3-oxoacyl-[acyl-carrier protein] reductase
MNTSTRRTAIVTGGGRHVGRTITEALAEMDFRVHICGRTASELERTAREVPRVQARVLDLRDRVGIERWVRDIVQAEGRIDVLVNNAAVMTPLGAFVDNALDEWWISVEVNLLGTAIVTHAVLPCMIRQREGHIINLGGGGSAYPRAHHTAYACSKAAVVRFSDTLAEEVREYNIKVNVLSPGQQYSRMREQDRQFGIAFPPAWDSPEKLKSLARFLAETEITGKFVHVNDDYRNFDGDVLRSDLYTLRRINP